MHASSSAGHIFALDLSGLRTAYITRWSASSGERIASIGVARARAVRRLSPETRSGIAFEPALRLYRSRGFTNGAAFDNYVAIDFNQFLHLDL